MTAQGTPVWYELSTSDPDAAQTFYGKVLGWAVSDSGMAGIDYRLARMGGAMVAGMAALPGPQVPPNWMIYFEVDDCDATAGHVEAAGGRIVAGPADIPETGRYAVLTDPQGAHFGILQSLPMETPQAPAFDQGKAGHGNWHELMSTDPKAGLDFYTRLFGWKPAQAMDMGEMGTYQLFSHAGKDIGGMMGLGNAPVPCWLPYFGTTGTEAAIGRIKAGGGEVIAGPMEVPGGAWIAVARDPQGAHFAVVGPK